MTRAERSEYTYIKNSLKNRELGSGCLLTIRTDAGREYKESLYALYYELGFHPAAVTTDPSRFDEKERVVFIYGLTWECEGHRRPWTELYTKEELFSFTKAILKK